MAYIIATDHQRLSLGAGRTHIHTQKHTHTYSQQHVHTYNIANDRMMWLLGQKKHNNTGIHTATHRHMHYIKRPPDACGHWGKKKKNAHTHNNIAYTHTPCQNDHRGSRRKRKKKYTRITPHKRIRNIKRPPAAVLDKENTHTHTYIHKHTHNNGTYTYTT